MNLKVEAHLTAVADLIPWSSMVLGTLSDGRVRLRRQLLFLVVGLLYTRKAFRDLRAGKCFREGQLKGF